MSKVYATSNGFISSNGVSDARLASNQVSDISGKCDAASGRCKQPAQAILYSASGEKRIQDYREANADSMWGRPAVATQVGPTRLLVCLWHSLGKPGDERWNQTQAEFEAKETAAVKAEADRLKALPIKLSQIHPATAKLAKRKDGLFEVTRHDGKSVVASDVEILAWLMARSN